ncbi:MAG: NUDIX hydrolase [Oscillospiraceae bacterium]|nr:NUDIX hydrolase [Oscillospiraceae bacterium]
MMQHPENNPLHERTVKQNTVFEGRIITVRRDDALLPNGKPCTREVVEHPGGVTVAALTDQNELLFVRQYRYPYGEILLELPAGKLERGEDPLLCGKRELLEETGAIADRYESLGLFYPTPGYCAEIIHMYLATQLRFAAPSPDEDEFLELVRIPLAQAKQMVLDGSIRDGKTQAAVLKLSAHIAS